MVRFLCRRLGVIASLGLIFASVFDVTSAQTAAAEIARYDPPAPPPLSARAVFVTDITSGTELFALNPDTSLAPASLTKIVSALVILERGDLNARVSIVAEDLVGPEESQVGLVEGDRLTVRDLLFGVLIPSGNDATRALARYVGSESLAASVPPDRAVAEFTSLMNEKARELGATSSTFKNPTGIDAEGHQMSARDVATLTAAALANPLFVEIVSTPTAVLSSEMRSEGYAVQTTNQLLLEGTVNGVKTGTTAAAGGCLVTTLAVGPNTIIAVVLGSSLAETTDGLQDNSARYADTKLLLEAVTAEYLWLNPVEPETVAGLQDEMRVWQVDLADDALLPVPAAETTQLRYRLILQPPSGRDQLAGELQFYVGERLLSERAAVQVG
ncbi:MAG: D-alanyl-D-alanine carboxypeptidase [Chloroflexia bacterium]|nr:D-alanyl-D-alanine carboxypeptidase [Chloroflexia bacterium]